MEKGILHLHVTVVLIFLILFTFKTILLLLNKDGLLEKVRAKTKVVEMVIGTFILITGGFLLFKRPDVPSYLVGKIIIVLVAIPLGIIALKRKNKILAVVTLFAFVYAYGVAETKSLKFKKDKFVLPDTAAVHGNTIISENQNNSLSNTQAIYTTLCAKCHGADGKLGVGGAKDLSVSTLTTQQKEEIITTGKGLMQSFKDQLSEAEIKALAAYTDSFKK
jgi:cytochrome c553